MADAELEDGDDADTRDEDEAIERVLTLAKAGWGIDDIASDADRDPEWVIDTLATHKDCFRPGSTN